MLTVVLKTSFLPLSAPGHKPVHFYLFSGIWAHLFIYTSLGRLFPQTGDFLARWRSCDEQIVNNGLLGKGKDFYGSLPYPPTPPPSRKVA